MPLLDLGPDLLTYMLLFVVSPTTICVHGRIVPLATFKDHTMNLCAAIRSCTALRNAVNWRHWASIVKWLPRRITFATLPSRDRQQVFDRSTAICRYRRMHGTVHPTWAAPWIHDDCYAAIGESYGLSQVITTVRSAPFEHLYGTHLMPWAFGASVTSDDYVTDGTIKRTLQLAPVASIVDTINQSDAQRVFNVNREDVARLPFERKKWQPRSSPYHTIMKLYLVRHIIQVAAVKHLKNTFTVRQLKNACKALGLSTKGRRFDLRLRLHLNILRVCG
jgi:hypothetical protein